MWQHTVDTNSINMFLVFYPWGKVWVFNIIVNLSFLLSLFSLHNYSPPFPEILHIKLPKSWHGLGLSNERSSFQSCYQTNSNPNYLIPTTRRETHLSQKDFTTESGYQDYQWGVIFLLHLLPLIKSCLSQLVIKAIHWELVPLTLIYIELKAHLLGIPYDKAHGLIARRKEYLFLSPFFLIKKKKRRKRLM